HNSRQRCIKRSSYQQQEMNSGLVTKSEATPRVLPRHRCNLGPPSSEEEMNEEEFDMKEKTHHLNNTKSAPNASSS
ncbi:hypothetical protein MKW92_034863, partial [Papaver armeniacum]